MKYSKGYQCSRRRCEDEEQSQGTGLHTHSYVYSILHGKNIYIFFKLQINITGIRFKKLLFQSFYLNLLCLTQCDNFFVILLNVLAISEGKSILHSFFNARQHP